MPSANWLLAAAWVWLALAAFAACVWDRTRHRLPRAVATRIGGGAGGALLVACLLFAWGCSQPMNAAVPDAPATALWRGMALAVAMLHLAAASCLLGGTIYLAFGRLMGTRACSACGWQTILVERLPEATVAAAVTGLGMGVFQEGKDALDRGLIAGLTPFLGLVAVWSLGVINRSVAMLRQPAIARTVVVWLMLLDVAWLGWCVCRNSMAGDAAAAGWLAGCAFGVALAVLAAAIHRQAMLLGLRFDRPAALAEIVGGLSPLRRLAACAIGGLLLAGGFGLALASGHREDLAGADIRLLVVVVAFLWLLVTWGAALLRDRLGPACSPSITIGTIMLVAGLGSMWARIDSQTVSDLPAAGVPAFVGSLLLAGLGAAWCIVTVLRWLRPGG